MKIQNAAAIAILACLQSCQLPTKARDIAPVFTPSEPYEAMADDELTAEVDRLREKENLMHMLQKERRRSSLGKVLFTGWNDRDGGEAEQLGLIRGQIQAVARCMDSRGMNVEGILAQPEPAPTPKSSYSTLGKPSRSRSK